MDFLPLYNALSVMQRSASKYELIRDVALVFVSLQ